MTSSGVEPVEAEEWVFDGQNLDLAEARLAGVAAQRIRAHDGTSARRRLLSHASWQAEHDARGVHEALHLVGGRGERFADALIHDDDRAAIGHQPPDAAERLDWVGHIMQRLEDRYQVVAPGERWVSHIAGGECYAVSQAVLFGDGAGGGDRWLIAVEAVYMRLGIGAGDAYARPAIPTGDVGDSRGRIGLQSRVDIG